MLFPSFLRVCLLLFLLCGRTGASLDFSYYPTITDEHRADFLYENGSNLALGALQVTADSRNFPPVNQAGRVLYRERLTLWRAAAKSTVVATWKTSFVLNVLNQTNPGGEGMAFVLAASETTPRDSHGQWLGLVSPSTNGLASNQIVAVEFDTRKSDAQDVDDNHVGVDVNSVYSVFQSPLGGYRINLSTGSDILVSIIYNGTTKNITINLSVQPNKTGTTTGTRNQSTASFTVPLDLSAFLPEKVYVGFSASTSNFTELNCVKAWNFTSDIGPRGWLRGHLWLVFGPVAAAAVTIFIVLAGVTALYCRRKRDGIRACRSNIDLSLIQGPAGRGSRQFRFRDLRAATQNFSEKNVLGRGGFGIVYKGFLKPPFGVVAVKRLLPESCRRETEFLSEVTTIGRLSHPNLVKLIGWCSEGEELLLVYEYMANGSLHELLHATGGSFDWERRFRAISDVASAVAYLHDDTDHKMVFHRDIKPRNVMLDSDYTARVGDFGLARTVEDAGKLHHTTKFLAGTPCYVAPEYCDTGKASMKTDVYALGALVIEVACGRIPVRSPRNNYDNSVVDWAWGLYGADKVSEAADPQLNGEFDRGQMEVVLKLGLACCHPYEDQRPLAAEVVEVLRAERPPPCLPREKPVYLWPEVATPSSRVVPLPLEEILACK